MSLSGGAIRAGDRLGSSTLIRMVSLSAAGGRRELTEIRLASMLPLRSRLEVLIRSSSASSSSCLQIGGKILLVFLCIMSEVRFVKEFWGFEPAFCEDILGTGKQVNVNYLWKELSRSHLACLLAKHSLPSWASSVKTFEDAQAEANLEINFLAYPS